MAKIKIKERFIIPEIRELVKHKQCNNSTNKCNEYKWQKQKWSDILLSKY